MTILNSLPSPTEHEIQHTILDYLNKAGHFCWRNNTGAVGSIYKGKQRFFRFGFRGSADILGISKLGRMIAIEVKRKGGKATDDQINFLENIRTRGGHAFVADCLEDVLLQNL